MKLRIVLLMLLAALVIAGGIGFVYRSAKTPPGVLRTDKNAEVVIWGATPAGVLAAVAAAREGRSVLLLEPGKHLGGMMSGGLGGTDTGIKETIGGYAMEFFQRVRSHYGNTTWRFEPRVAEKIFTEWLEEEEGVRVYFEAQLEGVEYRNADQQLTYLHVVYEDPRRGKRYNGRMGGQVFIDASYEGDVLERAGISHTWGREGREVYGESLAGVSAYSNNFSQVDVPLEGTGLAGSGFAPVSESLAEIGTGDRMLPAYNYRVCITQQRRNKVPFRAPAGYNPQDFELMRRYLEARPQTLLRDIFTWLEIPNNKVDLNNRGPVSTDFIGGNWDYPQADQRERIIQAHEYYTRGLLHFLANDPSVPLQLRRELSSWGYCRDEFKDSDHFPFQLYVRECRRLQGAFVLTQQDVQKKRAKEDSIAMGSNYIESHHVQRFLTPEGKVMNEGFVYIKKAGRLPYDIPYRCITPKQVECPNLLVPVCLSASHVAYSSIRMEPQYMMLGHAAGIAASMAVESGMPVQRVPVNELQAKLVAQGQLLGKNVPEIFNKRRP